MSMDGRSFVFRGFFLALLATIFCGLVPERGAAAPRQVLVVPFSIHSDKDLTFLRKGITAMLSSRLTEAGKVAVINQAAAADTLKSLPTPVTREAAAEAARQVGADYVAFGSLTVFGSSISTDARFIEAETNTILVTFNATGQSQGDVITHINQFSGEVNGRVFGRAEGVGSPAAAPATAPAPAAQPAPDPEQMNPEKKIWGSDGGMRIQATNPDTDHSDAKMWRSRRFTFHIHGLSLGDVDGDGAVETVFAGDKTINVYRSRQGQFLKVSEMPIPVAFVPLSLDVADINGNGKAEIFVIGRTAKYYPMTLVLEWDGTRFQTLTTLKAWYYRVVRDPHSGGAVLYGQKGFLRQIGQRDTYNPVVTGPLYRMAWTGGTYEPQEAFPIPDEGSVFGFARGDITGDGIEDWVTYTDKENLQLTTVGNRENWISMEPYGGRYAFLMSPGVYRSREEFDKKDPDPTPMSVFFVPQRVLLTDFDKDGRNEVLVVQNHDITQGLIQRSRSFRQGHFESLAWDNVGLQAQWRTRKFSGYISDFNRGDIDNDGQEELVFAVVKKTGAAMGDAKSYLVSWNPYQGDQVPTE